MNKTRPQIKIEVVSDVVCPWCYIGKRRMETAVEQLQDKYDFEITFSPFELHPDMPVQGVDQSSYLSKKFGGAEQYAKVTGHVTQVARGEGLAFDFTKQKVSPNTRDAHRVIWFAKKKGLQPAVKEVLMKAYFEQGVDLSKKDNLADVAASAGMDRGEVMDMLQSNEYLSEVVTSEQISQQRGVTGVPFYIINDKYGVSGAQPSSAFADIFQSIGSEISLQGETCVTDGRDC